MSENSQLDLSLSSLAPVLVPAIRKAYPGWKVNASDIVFPKQGISGLVAYVKDDHVVKAIINSNNSAISSGMNIESWVLRLLTKKLEETRMLAPELLGVHVPAYMEPAEDLYLPLFAMDHVPGVARFHLREYSNHPDVFDQLSTFVIAFDRIVSDGFRQLSGNSPDKLDQLMFKVYRACIQKEQRLRSWNVLTGLDMTKVERGKKVLEDINDKFSGYIEFALDVVNDIAQDDSIDRVMHADFHYGNSIFYIEKNPDIGEKIQVGIIDFGDIFLGNPYVGFAKMMVDSEPSGYRMILESIDQVNEKSDVYWADPSKCALITPLIVAVGAACAATYYQEINGSAMYPESMRLELKRRMMDVSQLVDQIKSFDTPSFQASYPRNRQNSIPFAKAAGNAENCLAL